MLWGIGKHWGNLIQLLFFFRREIIVINDINSFDILGCLKLRKQDQHL